MKKEEHRFALEEMTMLQDRYRIGRVLGSNGISITYDAYDTFREQHIVIKELYPAAVVERDRDDKAAVLCTRLIYENEYAGMKEHMIREAKLLIKLYPLAGIANVITCFEANQTVYIVEEFVEGISLPEYISRTHRKKLMLRDAVRLLRPVITSLEWIHAKGGVHGRINPSLIRIDKEGRAVLLGFGDPMEDAAKAIAEDAAARVEGYAPVEQYIDEGGYSPATDVYAVAAILYEMVTGERLPAFYERIGEADSKQNQDHVLPPSYYNGTVMDYQSKAIMKALSIYHFDRYQRLGDFITAIGEEEFAKDDSIRMRDKPVRFAMALRYRRITGWTAALCLLVLALFFIPAAVTYITGMSARSFYTKLEEASVYEQCRMIDGLSESLRDDIANDYTRMEEEGEHEIHYYDKVTGRLVVRKQLDLDAELVRYISLDYRTGGKAILTIVNDGGKKELTIALKETPEGYLVKERVTGEESIYRAYVAKP